MVKCPNCGSTAQIEIIDTNYYEMANGIDVEKICACGCGCDFTATALYIKAETTKYERLV